MNSSLTVAITRSRGIIVIYMKCMYKIGQRSTAAHPRFRLVGDLQATDRANLLSADMEYLLANIIFMFFHGLFISCLYASDYVTLLNMTWTRD